MLVNKLINRMLKANLIQEEEKEIIQYGLLQTIVTTVSFVFAVLLGKWFGILFYSIIFLIAFVVLRSFAGGYHADSKVKCYIFSICCLGICYFFMSQSIEKWIWIVLLIISAGIVFVLSPIANPQKALDLLEVRTYRQSSNTVLSAEVIISVASLCIDVFSIHVPIICAICLVATLLLLGKLKYKILK